MLVVAMSLVSRSIMCAAPGSLFVNTYAGSMMWSSRIYKMTGNGSYYTVMDHTRRCIQVDYQ
jgi:hypothetical protein